MAASLWACGRQPQPKHHQTQAVEGSYLFAQPLITHGRRLQQTAVCLGSSCWGQHRANVSKRQQARSKPTIFCRSVGSNQSILRPTWPVCSSRLRRATCGPGPAAATTAGAPCGCRSPACLSQCPSIPTACWLPAGFWPRPIDVPGRPDPYPEPSLGPAAAAAPTAPAGSCMDGARWKCRLGVSGTEPSPPSKKRPAARSTPPESTCRAPRAPLTPATPDAAAVAADAGAAGAACPVANRDMAPASCSRLSWCAASCACTPPSTPP